MGLSERGTQPARRRMKFLRLTALHKGGCKTSPEGHASGLGEGKGAAVSIQCYYDLLLSFRQSNR